ncbi:hypothetical protein FACS1894172_00250 [Spirochaetia bacterium]|nr:hypothetical protein FACS1894164_16660 [Spirochaetia bacterium]GHU29339.1 hypothetical protein FACS1894172_00250 [Spirochaetia bacterium]
MAWLNGGEKFGQWTFDHWYDNEIPGSGDESEDKTGSDHQTDEFGTDSINLAAGYKPEN